MIVMKRGCNTGGAHNLLTNINCDFTVHKLVKSKIWEVKGLTWTSMKYFVKEIEYESCVQFDMIMELRRKNSESLMRANPLHVEPTHPPSFCQPCG